MTRQERVKKLRSALANPIESSSFMKLWVRPLLFLAMAKISFFSSLHVQICPQKPIKSKKVYGDPG